MFIHSIVNIIGLTRSRCTGAYLSDAAGRQASFVRGREQGDTLKGARRATTHAELMLLADGGAAFASLQEV